MGQIAETLGLGPEIAFEGRVYRLALIEYHLRGQFETWLERRAEDKLRARYHDRPAELDQRLTALDRDVAAGVYSFGSPVCVQAIRSAPGLKKLLQISLNENHPEVDDAFVDRLFDSDPEAAARALNRSEEASSPPKATEPSEAPA